MTAKNNLLSNMLSMNQYLQYDKDNEAIDMKYDPKLQLPAIRAGGGDLSNDQYNHTMVEFGSIR